MDITESDRKAPESGVTEEIWLHYFNDILRVRGVITMREYTKMELKILSRNIAKKVENQLIFHLKCGNCLCHKRR